MSARSNKEELSLKEIIINFHKWRLFLMRKWLILAGIFLFGALAGGAIATYKSPKYKGELSFVLSSGDGTKMGGLSGLAGQLGLDVGGGGSDVFSSDNITALMTSRKMIEKALFRKIDSSRQTILNVIASEMDFNKRWRKSKRTQKAFPFPSEVELLTPIQDSLVREIYTVVIDKIITVEKPNKKQSIFLVTANSTNESVAVFFPKYLVNETARFYISTKTKVASQNLHMLQNEADSLRNLLSGTISSTGSSIDRTFNLNSAYQVQRSAAQEGQLNVGVISSAYGEVLKNLEIAKITLQKETPLFQIIDEPFQPLRRDKLGKVKGAVLGGIIALMLGVIGVSFQKLYNIILA